jgi:phage terminase Nu1 subunit (DNA packaging protein)
MLNNSLDISPRWFISSSVPVTNRVASDIAAILLNIPVSFCQRMLEKTMFSIDRSLKC